MNQTEDTRWVAGQINQTDAYEKYGSALVLNPGTVPDPKPRVTSRSPDACRDLLMYIRHSVERPWIPGTGLTKYTRDVLVFKNHPKWGKNVESCPLGLLPDALCCRPILLGHFRPEFVYRVKSVKQWHLERFVEWWDSQENGAHAVNAVWGIGK